MICPRLEKLEKEFLESGGEWREIKIDDFFKNENGDFDIQKKHLTNHGELVISSGFTDRGIIGRTNAKAKIIDQNCITVDMFGNSYARNFPFKMVTHARVFALIPNIKISIKALNYIVGCMHFLNKKYNYNNMATFEKIKNEKISLPFKNGEINFSYMEKFIEELEALRIEELEALRIEELEAYLTTTGLKDYQLTSEDYETLDIFKQKNTNVWKQIPISDVFNKLKTKRLPYTVSYLTGKKDEKYSLPATTAGFNNQGLTCYVPKEEATILKNVISIASNGNAGMMFYQPNEFTILQDSYAIEFKDKILNKNKYLFLLSSLQKAVRKQFSWNNKAGWEKLKDKQFYLPFKNDEINFEFIEKFIRVIEKLVIKDVVLWADKKIEATKQVVSNN